MIDKKAADYAKIACTDSTDNFLKVYEAYQDGYKDGQLPENNHSVAGVILFIIMGALVVLATMCILHIVFGAKIFVE